MLIDVQPAADVSRDLGRSPVCVGRPRSDAGWLRTRTFVAGVEKGRGTGSAIARIRTLMVDATAGNAPGVPWCEVLRPRTGSPETLHGGPGGIWVGSTWGKDGAFAAWPVRLARRGLGAAVVAAPFGLRPASIRSSPAQSEAAGAQPDPTSSSGPAPPAAEPVRRPRPPLPTPTPTPSTAPAAVAPSIQIYGKLPISPSRSRPFAIQGTYHGGPDTFLRVERREGATWLAFPVQPKTDQSGRFIAHVELGQPGSVLASRAGPDSGVASEPFVLVIKG